jgi:hypothetical protein
MPKGKERDSMIGGPGGMFVSRPASVARMSEMNGTPKKWVVKERT